MFQWSDEEEEGSGCASSNTICTVQTGLVSVNMADGNDANLHCRMEAQKQTTRAQQKALDNIQHLLEQLPTNQNPNANHEGTSDSNHQEDENP